MLARGLISMKPYPSDMAKLCNECGVKKETAEFYVKDRRCKECRKARVRQHRSENVERIRAYDRNRSGEQHRVQKRLEYAKTPEGISRIRVGQALYIERNRDKRQAHTIVGNAVRDGKLIVPKQCQHPNCNRLGPVEAHHDDYSKPLAVRWLCNPCHRTHHKAEREKKRQLDKAA